MASRARDFPLDRPAGAEDFDFLLGRWRVHNRRIWRPLATDDEWEEFSASFEVRPVLGGLGNVGQFRTILGESYFERTSLRVFCLLTTEWHEFWIDTEECDLAGPARGGFAGPRGELFGTAEHEGWPVTVRLTWQNIDPAAATWEQALSADDGESWKTNWIMQLRRA